MVTNASTLTTSTASVFGQQYVYLQPPEPKMVVNGKQYVVVCNGRVEYADNKELAQDVANKLAHAAQADAFVLKPVSRTAPKRDVITTDINLK